VTGFHVGELRAFMDRFKPVTGKYDSAEKKKKAK
jgi:hypothetical protein